MNIQYLHIKSHLHYKIYYFYRSNRQHAIDISCQILIDSKKLKPLNVLI